LGEPALDKAVGAGTVFALTGPVDRVITSDRTIEIDGGHPLMASVTAMGCAHGAVMAACLCSDAEPFDAVAAACALFKLAGSEAVVGSSGPGTFVPAFLDALHQRSLNPAGETGKEQP
jgi:hydroxyethylthiazole kinase